MDIKNVAIIGSGTMGSGIAAQVANAGIPVTLLDLPSKEEEWILADESDTRANRMNCEVRDIFAVDSHLTRLWLVELLNQFKNS